MSIRSRICTSRYGVLRCSDDHGISILQHLAKGLWKDLTDPHKPSSCTCSLPACDGGVALHINRGNSNCNNSKCNNSKCSNSKCSKHSNSSNSSNMGVGVWVSGAEICLCIFLAMSFSDCLFCGTCIYMYLHLHGQRCHSTQWIIFAELWWLILVRPAVWHCCIRSFDRWIHPADLCSPRNTQSRHAGRPILRTWRNRITQRSMAEEWLPCFKSSLCGKSSGTM